MQPKTPICLLNTYNVESRTSENNFLEMYSVDVRYTHFLPYGVKQTELGNEDIIIITRNSDKSKKSYESKQSFDNNFYLNSLKGVEDGYSIRVIKDEYYSDNESSEKTPIFIIFDKAILPIITNFIPGLAVLLIGNKITKKGSQQDEKSSEPFETEIIFNENKKNKSKVIKFKGTIQEFNNVVERISNYVNKD